MRRRSNKIKEPKTSFSQVERNAIDTAITTLGNRELFHLVAPKFSLPSLQYVYRSLVPQDIWELLEKAKSIRQEPSVDYNRYTTSIPLVGSKDMSLAFDRMFRLEINSEKEFIPTEGSYTRVTEIPEVIYSYAEAAYTCLREWERVRTLGAKLTSTTTLKRSTVGYYWPCVAFLLKEGGQGDDTLSQVDRPGTLPAHLVEECRNTNTFVMGRAMLPEVPDNVDVGDIKVTLRCGSLSRTLWPLGQ